MWLALEWINTSFERNAMDKELDRDIASPSHQRPPFADPLADGVDPTAPGAPHEPGGTDYRQSKEQENAALNAKPDSEEEPRPAG